LRDVRGNFSIEYINILNFDTNGLILDDNRIIRPFTLNHNFSIEEEQQIIDNNQVNYTVLPNENGWYSDGIFESLFIKTNILFIYYSIFKQIIIKKCANLLLYFKFNYLKNQYQITKINLCFDKKLIYILIGGYIINLIMLFYKK
jgi:hypothetical protein